MDSTLFYKLLLAVERRENIKLRAIAATEKADQQVQALFIEAGLNPKEHYRLDEASLTATLVSKNGEL